jgi:hypothetical protein
MVLSHYLEGRIRFRIQVKGRIRIRIRIKVTSRIPICIKVIRNTELSNTFLSFFSLLFIHFFLVVQPCERSDKVGEGKSSHTLLLSGLFRGGVEVLVRAKLALSEGVAMQLTVRSQDPQVSELMTTAVA